jgi:hypothetical protein
MAVHSCYSMKRTREIARAPKRGIEAAMLAA